MPALLRKPPHSLSLSPKAHGDVFNIMLQILEDGRLTDSKSRTVDFSNAVLIMTSNVGAKAILEQPVEADNDYVDTEVVDGGKKSWFNLPAADEGRARAPAPSPAALRLKKLVKSELANSFRPEFLNRLDEIMVFDRLSRRDLSHISVKMLEDVRRRVPAEE